MSKTTKVTKPTNDELIELIQSYGTENNIEVLSSIDTLDEDTGIQLDVDQGFVDMFEVKYPGVVLDEVLQTFFENAIKNFTEQVKNDPDFAKEVQDFQDKLDSKA